jgi:hypothetical protein
MFEIIIDNLMKLPQETIQNYLSDSNFLFLLEESLQLTLPNSQLVYKKDITKAIGMSEEKTEKLQRINEDQSKENHMHDNTQESLRNKGIIEENSEKSQGKFMGNFEGMGEERVIGLIVITTEEAVDLCFAIIKEKILKVLKRVVLMESFVAWNFRKIGFDLFAGKLINFLIQELERFVGFDSRNYKFKEKKEVLIIS